MLLASTSAARAADNAWSSRLEIGGGEIAIHVAQPGLQASHAALLQWIRAAACAVTSYYGRFPVSKVTLEIVPVGGTPQFITGTTFGRDGAFIRIRMALNTTAAELRDDWVLTHEMVHLAFPSMADEHHWIEEGIATYVEPIARVAVGNLDATTVWRELIEGLPQGLPQSGDRGLDHTHTWGRTYWGGALFCFIAEIEIRRATANRYGLRDALRGIVAAGGNIEASWPIERALQTGDKAVGVPVLIRLYDQMKAAPVTPDLAALWKELGVNARVGQVSFDDRAPLASIRKAITSPSAADSRCKSTEPAS